MHRVKGIAQGTWGRPVDTKLLRPEARRELLTLRDDKLPGERDCWRGVLLSSLPAG